MSFYFPLLCLFSVKDILKTKEIVGLKQYQQARLKAVTERKTLTEIKELERHRADCSDELRNWRNLSLHETLISTSRTKSNLEKTGNRSLRPSHRMIGVNAHNLHDFAWLCYECPIRTRSAFFGARPQKAAAVGKTLSKPCRRGQRRRTQAVPIPQQLDKTMVLTSVIRLLPIRVCRHWVRAWALLSLPKRMTLILLLTSISSSVI